MTHGNKTVKMWPLANFLNRFPHLLLPLKALHMTLGGYAKFQRLQRTLSPPKSHVSMSSTARVHQDEPQNSHIPQSNTSTSTHNSQKKVLGATKAPLDLS